ncbi:ADR245Wp [Eremothecium gossypii ATCC 10895]|uniref:ADR245Wp n=1 Tax=Eremothecium gossypii (strain ATCC 10895 / CBS 109.51 / FGSC 9923 / NRRL Y-1056) TaxID=284811 RepID=Q75A05_EREGS|nr:ADR245Wp [Eremothecium gossypii ATCC 10895]AAS52165.2 ADR245Wp [Eremothecium gossypii ATCC 10895]AEY96464.1 FADR245Wp [Eremothecium gossypii FDAG1]
MLMSAPTSGGVPLFNLVKNPMTSSLDGTMPPNESWNAIISKKSGNLPFAKASKILRSALISTPCPSALATNSLRFLWPPSLSGPPTTVDSRWSKLLNSLAPMSAPPTAVWKIRITLAAFSPNCGMFSRRSARSDKLGTAGAAGFSSSPSRLCRTWAGTRTDWYLDGELNTSCRYLKISSS